MYVTIREYDCQSPSLSCPFAYLSASIVRDIPSFYATTTYTINTVLILTAAVLHASKLSTVPTAILLLLLTF